MNEDMQNAAGQAMMAIGLYTVALESTLLSMRAQVHGYLLENDPAGLRKFERVQDRAKTLIDFCSPVLLQLEVLNDDEIERLHQIRGRRNLVAHKGYNEILSLTVRGIEEDVRALALITKKLEDWNQKFDPERGNTVRLSVSPAIFVLWLEIALGLASDKLACSPPLQPTWGS